jgi:hypothetical protein
VSTQSRRDITERAEDLSNRGVRRLIAIFVKKGEVAEWSAASKSWVTLSLDAKLDDRTLSRPLLIRALLDAATADNEVVEALHSKGNPRLAEYTAQAREQGLARGRAQGREEGREQGREEGRAQGLEKGRAQGREEGLARGRIEEVCETLGIPIGPRERAQMQALDPAGLDALRLRIKSERHWPSV